MGKFIHLNTLSDYGIICVAILGLILGDYYGLVLLLQLMIFIFPHFFQKLSILTFSLIFAALFFISILTIFSPFNLLVFNYFHIISIFMGIYLLHNLQFIKENSCDTLIFQLLLLAFCILEIFNLVYNAHAPRLSSLALNPNSLSALGYFLFFISKYQTEKLLAVFFVLIGGSTSLILCFAVSVIFYGLVNKNRMYLLLIATFVGLVVIKFNTLITSFLTIMLIKVTYFYENLSFIFIENNPAMDAENLSALRRLTYLGESFQEFANSDWFFKDFEFREGAVLSATSVSPIFGMLLLIFWFFYTRMMRGKAVIYFTPFLLIWMFILPIISPLIWIFIRRTAVKKGSNHANN